MMLKSSSETLLDRARVTEGQVNQMMKKPKIKKSEENLSQVKPRISLWIISKVF